MKKSFSSVIALTLITTTLASTAHAAANDQATGYFDFGKFSAAEKSGEFVEVDIKSNIIGMVTQLAAKQEKEVADALRGLQAVRVNVLTMNEKNRDEIQKHVQQLRGTLDDKKWERLVTVQRKDADVAIFLKTRGQAAVEGIVVTVLNHDKQAVLVNIVGDIQPEKLSLIAERFNIDPLKEFAPHVAKK